MPDQESHHVVYHRVEPSAAADGDKRLLQDCEGTGQLSITDRMDVQLSVEETYAGALLLKAWQCLATATLTEEQ